MNKTQAIILSVAILPSIAFAEIDHEVNGNIEWPLLSLRSRDSLNVPKARIEPFLSTLGEFSGVFDDIWFCVGERYADSKTAESDAEFARTNLLPLCKKAGIDFSLQQGVTLGHAAVENWPYPNSILVTNTSWMVDRDGKRHVGIFCPRAADALKFVHDTVKATVVKTHPRVYWLDDDLRLGIWKPEGCFCERCMSDFNARVGGTFTREDLVARLFNKDNHWEPLRSKWIDFNAESLAIYGAAARKALNELKSDTILAYQAVWSDTIYTGRNFKPLLLALSENGKYPTAIRPGAGWYRETEDGPIGAVKKCLSVAREAERCRNYGGLVGSVVYENETFPRRFLSKSPSTQVVECALAMASGCDGLSVYGYCGEDYNATNEFQRLYRYFDVARPYFERMRKEVRNTRLGGVARYIGSHAAEMPDFDLRDEADVILAQMGVPVTCAEANFGAYYITQKSIAESDTNEIAAVRAKGAYEFDLMGGFRFTPDARKRNEILDKLDALMPGGMPVRLVESCTIRVLPRVNADGKTTSVTLFNLGCGDTDDITISIRRPAGKSIEWMSPDGFKKNCKARVEGDELIVRIPNLGACKIGTIFIKSDSEPFAWRGFMLDEARHFFGKNAVKSMLDKMAELKLNRFHWHLTDDQGWRLDIPGMPELVKYGAVRPSSPIPGTEADSDHTQYGPFYYTADDVKEIVDYAEKRGITVVPEIEIPGHTRALLAAHPEFACPGTKFERTPFCEYGICTNVVCAGNDEMLAYYKRIFDEVMKMFPGEYIHIGGDECPRGQWQGCAKCKHRMECEKLADFDELQGWLTRQMVEYISSKGRRAIGWDEVLSEKADQDNLPNAKADHAGNLPNAKPGKGGNLPKGTIIQSWRGTKGGIKAAKMGYDVIMSPVNYLYFSIPEGRPDDHYPTRYYSRINKMVLPASKVRSFNPLADIPPECAKHILGAECCAWTEVMHTPEELRFKTFTRLEAFADVVNKTNLDK